MQVASIGVGGVGGGCGEGCGWAAAVVAMLSFGSFGVPIKSETCQRLNIDPLVFQSYKSLVCFLSAALILGVMGHPFKFTPWGIVSAIFWVPGGVATVAAVKLAGLALAIAVGNSLIALVSFTWGIFVFQEPIHSQWMACLAVAMMIMGFSGMSYFSTRVPSGSAGSGEDTSNKQQSTTQDDMITTLRPALGRDPSHSLQSCPSSGESIELVEEARQLQVVTKEIHDFESKTFNNNNNNINGTNGTAPKKEGDNATSAPEGCGGLRHRTHHHVLHHHSNETVYSPKTLSPTSLQYSSSLPPHNDSNNKSSFLHITPQSTNPKTSDVLVTLLGGNWQLSRRQVGIALAIFNGCWGGSIMVPMKFCPDPTITSGIGYVWSFSIGAVLVTAALWVLRYLWSLIETKSPTLAYKSLPAMHIQEMWKPGGLSGLLWSIGNLFSILSVDSLGEGVGYSVVQASMLVSGLWGIFYFQEVKGAAIITKWFFFALMTVSGILLLSYEHHES